MRYLTLLSIFVFAGCTNVDNRVDNYRIKPEEFKCPADYFAYCEGRNPVTIECRCIDRRYQRQVIDRLTGVF